MLNLSLFLLPQIHEQVALEHTVVQLALFVRRAAEGPLELGVGGQQKQLGSSNQLSKRQT